jgi:hypothetical protein
MTKFRVTVTLATRGVVSITGEDSGGGEFFRTTSDSGFQIRGGALKKIAPSGGRREKFWGISCEKSRFYATKSYFFFVVIGQNCILRFLFKFGSLKCLSLPNSNSTCLVSDM